MDIIHTSSVRSWTGERWSLSNSVNGMLFDMRYFGSSSHLLGQTGAGSSEVLHVRLGAALPVIQDEVCGHFALQTGDVAMAEVITQVMHLRKQIYIYQCMLLTPPPNQCLNRS